MAFLVLSVDHTRISEDLSSFPLLIELADPVLRGIGAVGFCDSQGRPLPAEVEHLDPQTGRLRAWVGLAAVSSGADTVFRVGWGSDLPAPAVPLWGA